MKNLDLSLAFDFVKKEAGGGGGETPENINAAAQTGDMLIPIIVGILCVLAVGLVAFMIFRNRQNANHGRHFAKSQISNNGTFGINAISTKLTVIITSIVVALLAVFGALWVTQSHTAFGQPFQGGEGYMPDKITAYVDEETGAIEIEDGWLQNVGAEALCIDETEINIHEQSASIPGIANSIFTINAPAMGGYLYDGTNMDPKYGTKYFTQNLAPLAVQETTPLKFTLTNISKDSALQLIGKTVFTAHFYEDTAIDQPTANTGLKYKGDVQTGVNAGEGYELTGTFEATDAGTYKAYAKPQAGYKWAGKTGEEAYEQIEIEWSIDKLTVGGTWKGNTTDNSMSWTYDGQHHQPTFTISGLVEIDNGSIKVSGYKLSGSALTQEGTVSAHTGTYEAAVNGLIDTRTGEAPVNYTLESDSSQSYKITAKSVSITWFGDATPDYWTYNGQAKTKTASIGSLVVGDTCSPDTYNTYKFDGSEYVPCAADEVVTVGKYKFEVASLKNNTYNDYTLEGATGNSFEAEITSKSITTGTTITLDTNQETYDGEAHLPSITSVTATVGGQTVTLTEGTDYEINKDCALTDVITGGKPVKINGLGSFTGTATGANWNLVPITAHLTWDSASTFEYDKKAHSITAQVDNAKLGQDVEVISYAITRGSETLAQVTNAGVYTITAKEGIKLAGGAKTANYVLPTDGNEKSTFTITAKSLNDLTAEEFGFSQTDLIYDAKEKNIFNDAKLKIFDKRDSDKELTYNTDYTINDFDNVKSMVNANTRTITIFGKGNYSGSKEVSWTIKPKSIAGADITAVPIIVDEEFPYKYIYDGAEHSCDVKVTDKTLGKDLSGNDFELVCAKQKNAGTYDFYVKGKGNYDSNTQKAGQWTIKPFEISYYLITGNKDSFVYDTKEHSVEGFSVYVEGASFIKPSDFKVVGEGVSTSVKMTNVGITPMNLNQGTWSLTTTNLKFAESCVSEFVDGYVEIRKRDSLTVSVTPSKTKDVQIGDKLDFTVTIKNKLADTALSGVSTYLYFTDPKSPTGNFYTKDNISIDAGQTATVKFKDYIVQTWDFKNEEGTATLERAYRAVAYVDEGKVAQETYTFNDSLKLKARALPSFAGLNSYVYQAKQIDLETELKKELDGKYSDAILKAMKDSFKLTGKASSTACGEFTDTKLVLSEIYACWSDGKIEDVAYPWEITPAELTVSLADQTMTYGDTPSIANPTITGYISPDTKDVVNGSLVVKIGDKSLADFSKFSAVGDYDITLSGYEADNYTFTYPTTKPKLSVLAKPVGFKWDSQLGSGKENYFHYYSDGKAHQPIATVADPFPTEDQPDSSAVDSYKIYKKNTTTEAWEEVTSAIDVGIYKAVVTKTKSTNYMPDTKAASVEQIFYIDRSTFDVTFEAKSNNDEEAGGLVSANGATPSESQKIEGLKLGTMYGWQMDFSFDQENSTFVSSLYFMYMQPEDQNLTMVKVDEQIASGYHFNMWLYNGEKADFALTTESAKTLDSDVTFTALFSDEAQATLHFTYDPDYVSIPEVEQLMKSDSNSSVGVSRTVQMPLDESCQFRVDKYGSLECSILNPTLHVNMKQSSRMAAYSIYGWSGYSSSGQESAMPTMITPQSGWYDISKFDLETGLQLDVIGDSEEDVSDCVIFYASNAGSDSATITPGEMTGILKPSLSTGPQKIKYVIDAEKENIVHVTNTLGYVTDIVTTPGDDGKKFDRWYTTSNIGTIKYLTPGVTYELDKSADKMALTAKYVDASYCKVTTELDETGTGNGKFDFYDEEGEPFQDPDVWVPEETTWQLNTETQEISIFWGPYKAGSVKPYPSTGSKFVSWDIPEGQTKGTIKDKSNFKGKFDKIQEYKFYDASFKVVSIDGGAATFDKAKSNVPAGAFFLKDEDDPATLHLVTGDLQSQDLNTLCVIDSVKATSEDGSDFCGWFVDNGEGVYTPLVDIYEAVGEGKMPTLLMDNITIVAKYTPTAKAVYTRNSDDQKTTLKFYYDKKTHEEDEGFIASYPITYCNVDITDSNKSFMPEWTQMVNPDIVDFDASFKNYKIYGSAEKAKLGQDFESLDGFFAYMSNLDTASGFENINTENVKSIVFMFAFAGDASDVNSTLDLSKFLPKNIEKYSIPVGEGASYSPFIYANFAHIKLSASFGKNAEDGYWLTDMTLFFGMNLKLIDLKIEESGNDKLGAGCNNFTGMFMADQSPKAVNSLESIDAEMMDVSNGQMFTMMFCGCSHLNNLDLSKWNLSKALDARYMFYNCSALETIDLSNFNISSMCSVDQMFINCSSLRELDLSSIATTTELTMKQVFNGAKAIEKIKIGSKWQYFPLTKIGLFNDTWYDEEGITYSSSELINPTTEGDVNVYVRPSSIDIGVLPEGTGSVVIKDKDEQEVSNPIQYFSFEDPAKITEDKESHIITIVLPDGTKYTAEPDITQYEFTKWTYKDQEIPEAGLDIYGSCNVIANFDAALAKAVLSTDGKTLTFYFDKTEHPGTVINVPNDTKLLPESEEDIPASPFSKVSGTVTTVVFDDSFKGFKAQSMCAWFANFTRLKSVTGFEYINSSFVSMVDTFAGCTKLESIDMSKLNTPQLMGIAAMFYECTSLKSVKMPKLSYVLTCESIFDSCENLVDVDLNSMAFIPDWAIPDFVPEPYKDQSAENMFFECYSLKTIDLSKLDTTNLKIYESVFDDCTSLKSVDLHTLNTSQGTNFSYMFDGCSSLENVIFKTGDKADDKFSLAKATNLREMFGGCSSLTSIDFSNIPFNSEKEVDLQLLFNNCNNLSFVDISSFNTSKEQNLYYMFASCSSICWFNIGEGWKANLWKSESQMNPSKKWIHNNQEWSLEAIPTYPGQEVGSGTGEFSSKCNITFKASPINAATVKVVDDKTSQEVSSISFMANSEGAFKVIEDIEKRKVHIIDLKDAEHTYTATFTAESEIWQFLQFKYSVPLAGDEHNIISSSVVVYASYNGPHPRAFYSNKTISFYYDTLAHEGEEIEGFAEVEAQSPEESPFAKYGSWSKKTTDKLYFDASMKDCTSIDNTAYWFANFYELREIEGLNNLDTSNVVNMQYMFQCCNSLQNLDISSWDFSNVENTSRLFSECYSLTSINIGSKEMPNVVKMDYMFAFCNSLKNCEFRPVVGENSPLENIDGFYFQDNNLSKVDFSGIKNRPNSFNDFLRGCNRIQEVSIADTESWRQSSLDNYMPDTYAWWYKKDYTEDPMASWDSPRIPNACGGYGTFKKGLEIRTSIEPMQGGSFAGQESFSGNPFYGFSVSEDTTTHTLSFLNNASEKTFNLQININSGYEFTGWVFDPPLDSENKIKENTKITAKLTGNSAKAVITDNGQFKQATFYYDSLPHDEGAVLYLSNDNNNFFSKYWEALNLVTIDESYKQVDFITNYLGLFTRCTYLTEIRNIQYMDVTNVTDFGWMFSECDNLLNLDLSSWHCNCAESINYMFRGCTNLRGKIDLSGFSLRKDKAFLGEVFANCLNLEVVDISGFCSLNYDGCDALFQNDRSLKTIYVGKYWTNEGLHFGYVPPFEGCESLVGGNGTPFDPANIGCEYAVIDKPGQPGYFTQQGSVDERTSKAVYDSGKKILTFVYDNETYADYEEIKPFSTVDIGAGVSPFDKYKDAETVIFDPSFAEFTYLREAPCWFSNFESLTSVTGIENLKLNNITSLEAMFYGCRSLESIDFMDNLDTSKVKDFSKMFYSCNIKNVELDMSKFINAENMQEFFKENSSLESVAFTGNVELSKLKEVRSFFISDSELTSVEFGNVQFPNVTNLSEMFNCCFKLASIDLSNFSGDSVRYANHMFSHCEALTEVNVSHWKCQSAESLENMFACCKMLKEIDIHNLQPSNCNNFFWMFYGCEQLQTIIVSDNGLNIKNDVNTVDMFGSCDRLEGQLGHNKKEIVDDDPWMTDGRGAVIDTNEHRGLFTAYSGNLLKAVASPNTTLEIKYDNSKYEQPNMRIMSHTKEYYYDQSPFSDVCDVSSITAVNIDNACVNGTAVKETTCWFRDMKNLVSINGIDNINGSNAVDTSNMFNNCASLTTQLDLWRFSNYIECATGMFELCQNVKVIDISGMKAPDGEKANSKFGNMFYKCIALEKIYASALFDLSQSQNNSMFTDDTKLSGCNGTTYEAADPGTRENAPFAHIDQGGSNPGFFSNKEAKAVITGEADNYTLAFYYDLIEHSDAVQVYAEATFPEDAKQPSDWPYYSTYHTGIKHVVIDPTMQGYSSFNNISYMFGAEDKSSAYTNIQDFTGLNNLIVNNTSEMKATFAYAGYNNSLFNGLSGLSSWNTDYCVNMEYMFAGYTDKANSKAPDIENWSLFTVSKMGYMFYEYGGNCTQMTEAPNLSHINIAGDHDMNHLLANSTVITTVDLTDWKSKCESVNTIDLTSVFEGCSSLTTIYGDDLRELQQFHSTVGPFYNAFKDCVLLPSFVISEDPYFSSWDYGARPNTPINEENSEGYFTKKFITIKFDYPAEFIDVTRDGQPVKEGITVSSDQTEPLKFKVTELKPEQMKLKMIQCNSLYFKKFILDENGYLTISDFRVDYPFKVEVAEQSEWRTLSWDPASPTIEKVICNGKVLQPEDAIASWAWVEVVPTDKTKPYQLDKRFEYGGWEPGKPQEAGTPCIFEMNDQNITIELKYLSQINIQVDPAEAVDYPPVPVYVPQDKTYQIKTLENNTTVQVSDPDSGEEQYRIEPPMPRWDTDYVFDKWEGVSSTPIDVTDGMVLTAKYVIDTSLTISGNNLTVSLVQNGGASLPNVQYKTESDADWKTLSAFGEVGTSGTEGGYIKLKGENSSWSTSASDYISINIKAKSGLGSRVYASLTGSVTSLLHGDNYEDISLAGEYCFYKLFTTSDDVDDLSFEKTTILRPTTLTSHCYDSMFFNCAALTKTIPVLPAEVLAPYCYANMFSGCEKMQTIEENRFKALTFAEGSCQNMFNGCSGLCQFTVYFTALPLATNALANWMEGCTYSFGQPTFCCPGTLVAEIEAAERSASTVPANWVLKPTDGSTAVAGIPASGSEPENAVDPTDPQDPDTPTDPDTPQDPNPVDPSEEHAVIPEPDQVPEPQPDSPDPTD